LEKLKKDGIIYPIRHSDWLSNPVVVRKKTGEIQMCVDFRDLNKSSVKDNYPLPNMEFLLQQVTGSACMSMLDGFSGYNQVLVAEEDRAKTTFITPWETYAYAQMPFGLKNVGATFQRDMDHAFEGLIGKFMVDYQDDLTVHSKTRNEHIHHLRKVFERCRLYGVSLNPKKCLFVVTEGKLLGHIVCKEGIYIDPERVKAINELNPPSSKKGVQSFFGKINFVRRFVPDYASIVKPINSLLKKDQRFEWTSDTHEAFSNIKKEITTAPVLISPDFQRDFIIYSFATEIVVASVLTQRNAKGEELPISFMRKTLHDYELRYSELEKQALSLVKAVAHFQTYILNSHVIAYVPSSPVKMLLNQQLREGKWENWLAKIQEYDIEIKPLKEVKGKGLCKLIVNGDALNGVVSVSIGKPISGSEWYKDIVFYLKSGQFPVTMTPKERRALKMKSNQYVLIVDVLFRRNYDGMLLRCVDEKRAQELMQEFHGGICGGHFAPTATTHKIIRVGFYWPSVFKDSYATVRKCISCQQFSGKMKRSAMPLQPIYVEQPFTQWGLDVIGPINPKSSKGNIYILTATDYFTKWKEAVALKRVDSEELIKFLKDNILSRFGVPEKFITDNGSIFIGSKFTEFCGEYGIVMGQSSNYYPQGNGLVESTNKTLIHILKKTIDQNQKNWHLKLTDALWESKNDSERQHWDVSVYVGLWEGRKNSNQPRTKCLDLCS
jgi:hypothetical protein